MKVRYAAIGDSYTICEGVEADQRWPDILTRHLNEAGVATELVCNPAVTGYTTQDLIDKELAVFDESKPNFATLLIGVNDWVQAVTPEQFRQNLGYIVDFMSVRLPAPERLIIITIPDFGVTPEGPKYSGGRDISEGLSRFNQIVAEVAGERGLPLVDVFPTSRKMADDPSLVSSDGLHPSAKMYAEWERLIFPAALRGLK
jgi:lysophospholipase L1-like esterase